MAAEQAKRDAKLAKEGPRETRAFLAAVNSLPLVQLSLLGIHRAGTRDIRKLARKQEVTRGMCLQSHCHPLPTATVMIPAKRSIGCLFHH